jgi:hypothetical protein
MERMSTVLDADFGTVPDVGVLGRDIREVFCELAARAAAAPSQLSGARPGRSGDG